jgi:hypothetical protein
MGGWNDDGPSADGMLLPFFAVELSMSVDEFAPFDFATMIPLLLTMCFDDLMSENVLSISVVFAAAVND